MVYKTADNIFSPLGETTEANYLAARRGESCLGLHEGKFGVPEPFMASLFDDNVRTAAVKEGVSFFEYVAVESIRRALEGISFDVSGENVVLILATTKAGVDDFYGGYRETRFFFKAPFEGVARSAPYEGADPGEAARRIARRVGVKTEPIVVCNACISGLSAIILAKRLLEQGSYDYAVVCGADVMGRFIVSGFQSLKIVSDEPCRPFDIERRGLNLGEAASTIVLTNGRSGTDSAGAARPEGVWTVNAGAVRNDANHISTPSAKGDGLYMALSEVMAREKPEDFALVNVHGTGTLFNDRMEAAALGRAGLSEVPVNALKGIFGHTMGACGVLETVLTMRALDDGVILGTRGFSETGVSSKVNISADERVVVAEWPRFIKTLSGFGGGNAAIVASRMPLLPEFYYKCPPPEGNVWDSTVHCTDGRVVITSSGAVICGAECVRTEGRGDEMLVNLYRRYVNDYPRFYKMDGLCRLGFIASELLLRAEAEEFGTRRFVERDDRAVAFFNRSSSVSADRRYLETIGPDDYYPSPSVFLYTLPNIVTGEIAIRNRYHGETGLYILPERDEGLIGNILATVTADAASVIAGWVEYEDGEHFLADVRLLTFACTEHDNCR